MTKLVLDMNDRRPVWAMPDWVIDEIRDALPEGWTLEVMDDVSDGTGDGFTRASEAVLAAVEEAEVYCGFGIAAEILERGKRLRWVHSGSAGVGSSLTPQMLASDVVFTNSKGVHGPPMAETVTGMILYFLRGFDFAVAGMRERTWGTEDFYRADSPVREISDITVGIFGFGGIGQEIAARLAPMGATILGHRRSGMNDWTAWVEPAEPARLPEAPKPGPGEEYPAYPVTSLSGDEGFERLLGESDVLVITAPATPDTIGAIDADAISRMKPGSILVNVSRGSLVDEPALIEALRSGHLRGAALDVASKEPLPSDSPLWDMPNVLVTPHVSPVTRGFWKRQAQLIVWNLRRLAEGRDLINVVDKQAGY